MTQNIEQRTLAAVNQYENASKTAHDLTNIDSIIDTTSGQVKSLPKVAKEWDAEREALSIKSKPVLAWVAGETETDLNQQRRFTDGHTYLPKSVPALMGIEPDANWIAYTADKSDVLSDVFGSKPVDLIAGLVLTPANNQYPKLSAFNAIYELADNSVSYTVKSFSQSADLNSVIITLNNDQQISAQKVDAASRTWTEEITDNKVFTNVEFVKVERFGISKSNTKEQNSALMNDLNEFCKTTGQGVLFDTGIYPFKDFKANGLIFRGKGCDDGINTNTTIIAVHPANGTPIAAQFTKTRGSDLTFKSMSGSIEWQRNELFNDNKLKRIGFEGFKHDSQAPNAWGVYCKHRCINSELNNCVFDDNSQSDIAILEGTDGLTIINPRHKQNKLHINLEPNSNAPKKVLNVLVKDAKVHKLSALSNDLNKLNDDALTLINSHIENMTADGLLGQLINTKIDNYVNTKDGKNRIYASKFISGILVGEELLNYPSFDLIQDNSENSWSKSYSQLGPDDRYKRLVDGSVLLNPNNKAGSNSIQSEKINCSAESTYCLTIYRKVISTTNPRPDVTRVDIYDAQNQIILSQSYARKSSSEEFDSGMMLFSTPASAAYLHIVCLSSDSSVGEQQVAYKHASLRQVKNFGEDISVGLSLKKPEKTIYLDIDYDDYLASNLYWCNVPNGTTLKFKYKSSSVCTAEVIEQPASMADKFGALAITSRY